ncbi:hypothetical protein N9L47_00475 [Rhodobacteraceae bacterium]|nr:hypothetical protein [Paracoccaceae bacterium]
MTLWEHLLTITRRMLREPREAAAELIGLEFRLDVLLSAFIAMIAVSIIATEPLLKATAQLFPAEPLPPLLRAIGSAFGGLAIVWVLWKAGGRIGGRATFDQILLGFVLLEVVFIVGIVGLLLLIVAVPTLAGIIALAFVFYWVWMMCNVIAELHGFPSAWKALGLIVVSWVVVNYASILVLDLLSNLVGGPSNV